jgi:predicted nucleic acid-binding protein
MIYFDSDVLIHYFIEQDTFKSNQSIALYQNATKLNMFACSLLSLQETAYVLSRLKVGSTDISAMMDSLISETVAYEVSHFQRATELAKKVGFQNINDCLHAAIAEASCVELVTFNSADFKKIQKYTNLKITLL